MPWKAIADLPGCKAVTPPRNYPELFVFKTSVDDTGWLIGPYNGMTRFATDLRHDSSLRDFLSSNRIRIGLRKTDVPPASLARQDSYGPLVPGDDCARDFTENRLDPIARPVREQEVPSINRKADREENVKGFWDTQTPQSHHIVEFNNLKTLGVSTEGGSEGMDYLQLPAVLLAAEFHQRYISAILKPAQRWEKVKLQSEIVVTYRDLYAQRSKLFEPMWLISKAVLERAGIRTD
jgi:hypothetical protein